jgi:predicted ribonuclease YlaK
MRQVRDSKYDSSFIKDSNLDTNNQSLLISEFKYNLVLDTNIFISNLNELDELSQTYSKDVLFSIPYLIIQELDKLKSRKDNNPFLPTKAQNAIKFIFNLLSQNRNFLFETSFQVNNYLSHFFILVIKIFQRKDLI